MADRFSYIRSAGKNEVEQMAIYAMCRRFGDLDERTQGDIRALCADIADDDREGRALFRFLTTEMSFPEAVRRFLVPEGKMKTMRREFYRRWEWRKKP